MTTEALKTFLDQHYAKAHKDHLRLGQRFVNTYIKGSWPELYYEADETKAAEIIEQWLIDHQYNDHLPEVVGKINLPH